MSPSYENSLRVLNICFTVLFSLECFIKMFAYGVLVTFWKCFYCYNKFTKQEYNISPGICHTYILLFGFLVYEFSIVDKYRSFYIYTVYHVRTWSDKSLN